VNARAPLITQAEYARRRGVAKSAVAKAVAEGRITLIDGKVNEQVANIQWEQNTRARADSARTSAPGSAGEGQGGAGGSDGAVVAEAGTSPAQPGASPSYNDFRTRREAADAERSEIELAKMRGRLVDRETVERAIFDAFRALRDAAFSAPQRAAPRVIGMADSRDIEIAFAAELRKAFEGWEVRMLQRLPARDDA
jgi:hypothetical protein